MIDWNLYWFEMKIGKSSAHQNEYFIEIFACFRTCARFEKNKYLFRFNENKSLHQETLAFNSLLGNSDFASIWLKKKKEKIASLLIFYESISFILICLSTETIRASFVYLFIFKQDDRHISSLG